MAPGHEGSPSVCARHTLHGACWCLHIYLRVTQAPCLDSSLQPPSAEGQSREGVGAWGGERGDVNAEHL